MAQTSRKPGSSEQFISYLHRSILILVRLHTERGGGGGCGVRVDEVSRTRTRGENRRRGGPRRRRRGPEAEGRCGAARRRRGGGLLATRQPAPRLRATGQSAATPEAMSAAATGTYSPVGAAGDKRRERREELRRHLAEDADWPRSDGRSFHDCRPAFMQTGPTTAASGSAYAEFGKTKVIVSVFGPRESKKAMIYSDTGRLNCNVSYTTFATPIRGQGSDNKEYSAMLHKALEGAVMLHTFPKTTVDVFALVLESGGSDLPIIISCASLALADAGIMMYDLVTSVSVSCFGKNIIIDPTSDEEAWQDGNLMIAFMPARKEITQLTLTGEWSDGKITNAVELCMDACSKLCDILRERLKDPASLASE